MIVMKFGGTSVGKAAQMNDVADIVSSYHKKNDIVVVVSAMSQVTNTLTRIANFAVENNQVELKKQLKLLRDGHHNAITQLQLPRSSEKKLLDIVEQRLTRLENLLHSIYDLGELSSRSLDLITSFGERINIHLVAAALQKKGIKAQPLEATELIITTDRFGSAQPLLEESAVKTKPIVTKLLKEKIVPVITGFIGATEKGSVTTLGRGGSDYSATILGNCLDAEEVWIWTDVDGVMTADPRIVKDPRTIQILSYNEASELSYFGAKVLHPLTMVPAALKEIPIVIKNTFNPDFAGTKIEKKPLDTKHGIKAISTVTDITLITLQGKGMIGVPGVTSKLFGAIAAEKISVHFISQASSEFNISFVVQRDDGERAVSLLKSAFELELINKFIETIKKEDGLAIVAVVGQGMRGKPGIAGKTFSSLGEAGISIRAIAQGSSERNISCLITDTDVPRAVQCIHDAFGLAL